MFISVDGNDDNGIVLIYSKSSEAGLVLYINMSGTGKHCWRHAACQLLSVISELQSRFALLGPPCSLHGDDASPMYSRCPHFGCKFLEAELSAQNPESCHYMQKEVDFLQSSGNAYGYYCVRTQFISQCCLSMPSMPVVFAILKFVGSWHGH